MEHPGHSHIDQKLGEIAQWQIDHGKYDEQIHKEMDARLDVMDSNISLIPTKDEIKDVVRDALIETLFTTGKWTKVGIVTLATVIGSLVVISGGFKWLLGLIGFTYLNK